MKLSPIGSIAFACALGACFLDSACARKSMAAEPPKDTLGGVRDSVELTVYSEDFAMVKEQRPFDVKSGPNVLRVAGVSKSLDPSSILFNCGEGSGTPQVVASTYDLGISDPKSLLRRYVGQQVEVVRYGQDGKAGDKDQGTLEIASDGGIALHAGDKYLIDAQGTVVAPAKSDIVTIPQLAVTVDSPSAQAAKLDVTYVTSGLSWRADYVGTLSPTDDNLNLECWATVTNATGANFPNAKVTLVAGSPNRAVRHRAQVQSREWAKEDITLGAPTADIGGYASPTEVGELYEYPAKEHSTIAEGRMNRVKLLGASSVKARRDYSIRLPQLGSYFYGPAEAHLSSQLAITFVNDGSGGLGIPLPAGAIRMYEPDASGGSRYVGAADIANTAKDGHIAVTISNVFNVSARYRVVSTTRPDKHRTVQTVEVTIDNQKSRDVDVRLVQDFSQGWSIGEGVDSGKRLSSLTNQWTIHAPSGKSTILRYKVAFGR